MKGTHCRIQGSHGQAPRVTMEGETKMKRRHVTAAVLAATMAGALGMSACKPADGPKSPSASQSVSAADTNRLLQLNDSLREKLGADYSDSWIEGGQLHVAVTSEAAAAAATEAGAVAQLVTRDAAALESALQAVMAWRASLPSELGNAIHKVTTNGRAGTVEISVAPDQADAVKAAAEADKPAGDVPLVFKDSPGLATPL